MLKVSHLTKEYGELKAVHDISFEAKDKKIYGFLGPNGAGKSTTMNMITGYISPTYGSIMVNDISMLNSPEKAKKYIGYLPEIPPLYMDMTVLEYLDFVVSLKGFKGKDAKCDEIDRVIELTHIEDVAEQVISTLSKGYKQRVGVAQALVGEPDIIILDEPSVGLDPKQIIEIRELIKELGKEHTVILSTHILSEASAVCDEIVIISNGKIVAKDSKEALIDKYNECQLITLVLKCNASNAEKILNNVKGIDEYEMLNENINSCTISIKVKKGLDIREDISTKCVDSNVKILELNVHRSSLEDIYLKLTGEES